MSTTTIRLPEDLKARIARAAERSNQTAHSFILEAIAEKADQEERRSDFDDIAEQRYANIVATGKTIPWATMRSYLEARLEGSKSETAANKAIKKPRAKKLAR